MGGFSNIIHNTPWSVLILVGVVIMGGIAEVVFWFMGVGRKEHH
jgi:hypothetical protein